MAAGTRGEYLWPDVDDTFHVFSYTEGIPKLNENYILEEMHDEDMWRKAENLFQLVKLDHVPESLKDRDYRFRARNEAYGLAKTMFDMWTNINQNMPELMEKEIEIIVEAARGKGFFSCWMEVFKNELAVKKALIRAFPGTREEYCL
ncbi:hypothetical protein ACT26D_11220 [Megasphaera elsdenii]|uniref:hypothetical protein n=1 Tax=Megasphaera elsdenii TaxID=907 RepID=UPI00403724CD